MTDWQISHSDDFTELPPEALPSVWRRRGWGLLATSLALGLALTAFWQQRREGQVALAEDLKAAIFAEETQRFLGRSEGTLYQAEAPLAWQKAYRRSFQLEAAKAARSGEPPTVLLTSIDSFDGRCALVTLANAPHDPVRAYCLAETGWLRAPIPPATWGEVNVLALRSGLRLRFRDRDRAFAEGLAKDLARLAKDLPLAGLEISLEPHDLAGPLIRAEAGRISLNSQELVSTGAGIEPEAPGLWQELSGPELIRLALARVLINHSGRFRTPLTSSLPGAARFAAAAQTVSAMSLLLDEEAQDRLRKRWRSTLAGGWVSPFFAGLLFQNRPLSPGQAEAAALLTTDYLYQRHGPEAFPQLLPYLSQAASWNQVFGNLPMHAVLPAMSDRSLSASTPLQGASEQNYATLLLEIEVAHYAGLDKMALARLYREYGRPLDRPPLAVRLRYLDNRGQSRPLRFPAPRFSLSPAGVLFNWPHPDDRLQGWRLYVSQPGQPEPLLVETSPDLALTTPDGLTLSPGCLGPGADLAIEGEWLEAPRRFQASQITVQRALRLSPRPASGLPYLGLQTGPESGSPSQLVALTAGGSPRSLFDLNPRLRLFPLPIAKAEPLRLLIQSDAPTCSRSWFGLYEPGRGVIRYWFAPAAPVQWVWRPDQGAPTFIKRSDDRHSYQIYEADRHYAVQQVSLSGGASFWFLGWGLAEQRLITVGFRSYGTLLGLLDPPTDQMTWLASPPVQAIRSQGLSPAGDWLAYPAGLPSLFGPSGRLYLLHLERPARPSVLRLGPGQGLASLAWSPNLEQPALALLAGPIVAADAVRPTRLLWVDPNRPETYLEMAQAGEGEQFASPVFCRNGDLLYLVEAAGRYELRRQQPGQPAKILFSLERPFYPIGCAN